MILPRFMDLNIFIPWTPWFTNIVLNFFLNFTLIYLTTYLISPLGYLEGTLILVFQNRTFNFYLKLLPWFSLSHVYHLPISQAPNLNSFLSPVFPYSSLEIYASLPCVINIKFPVFTFPLCNIFSSHIDTLKAEIMAWHGRYPPLLLKTLQCLPIA